MRPFHDRADAGRQLADRLTRYRDRSDVIVLALPRGGVPVGAEIAVKLRSPLDVFLVRKLGVPSHPELAMGAIAEGGVKVLSQSVIRDLDISRDGRRIAFAIGAIRPEIWAMENCLPSGR